MASSNRVSSSIINTGKGGYHPGVGLRLFDRPVTISTNGPIRSPYNGMELRINTTQDGWDRYGVLPAYLLGSNVFATTVVNETDSGTFTVTAPCTAYLLRNDTNWSAVDLTGWTLYANENGTTLFGGTQYDGQTFQVYTRDFAIGTHPFDNNSAMYFWKFDNLDYLTQPSGSTGTLYVGTFGDTTTPNQTAVNYGFYNKALDPFHNGPITYSLVSGSLPPGLSLNSSTGFVTGSYTVQGLNTDGGTYSFTIRATDRTNLNYTDRAYTITLGVPWIYRQIISTIYMAGGYKDSQLWSNVNRFPRATETCTNLGDGTIDNFHYKSGMCDDTRLHIFNVNTTTTFNMVSEVKVNGVGAPGYACGNTATVFAPDRNRSYTVGEGVNNCFRFTASTNSFATIGGGQGSSATGMSGFDRGLVWGDGGTRRIVFATEAQAAGVVAAGAHHQQKGMSAKTGFGYGGNEGTYENGFNWRKINITNETNVGTFAKPQESGEENYAMAQDRGYVLGQFNGAQNNICMRVIYSNDATATLGTTVQGHAGASSGHCGWKA